MQNIDTPPLVSIFCITYNHSSYIRQCLDGFLIQKTNFPFEVLIHDDASTDDTAGIIKEYEAKYPDIIKPIYQVENQYSKGLDINIVYNLPRARGKYIAMCEGDDYWIDPLKLQKQVDFLENNLYYSFCCHRFKIYDQEENKWENEYAAECYKDNQHLYITRKIFFEHWVTQPLTAVIRKEKFNEARFSMYRYKYSRDVHLFYHLLKRGKGIVLNDIMGVYRIHKGGIASKKESLIKLRRGFFIYKELYLNNIMDMRLCKLFVYYAIFYYKHKLK